MSLPEVQHARSGVRTTLKEFEVHAPACSYASWRWAVGVMWEDVGLAEAKLHVRRALQRTREGVRLLDVKTKETRRTVWLPLFTIRALQKHRARQAEEREAADADWTVTRLVFTGPRGAPLDPQLARRAFTRALRRAGLPHMRFHDLRSSCASLLLAQGLDLKVIQEILGHSTITVTANLYAHVLMGHKRQAANQMDVWLGDADEDEREGVEPLAPTDSRASSLRAHRAPLLVPVGRGALVVGSLRQ